jgi:hypothetical protein
MRSGKKDTVCLLIFHNNVKTESHFNVYVGFTSEGDGSLRSR